ncbi:MAG: hypothetical protein IJ644_04595 [Oscillospiraceae bacterium]|nr:hypothetical protein [Oscillospiraceae bacterium]
MIRIQNIRLNLDYTELDLKKAIGRKLHIPFEDMLEIIIRKRSVDARKKDNISFLFTIDVKTSGEKKILQKCAKDKDISLAENKKYKVAVCHSPERPVVIGFGPAGMFASYVLAKAGLRPIILERGCPVEERTQHVTEFRSTGILNPESNVQFGEGGAGTFSDGKLNTGIKDERIRFVLETFAQCGAPEEILWQAKPHIGTDKLQDTVRNFRHLIQTLGGEIHFHAKFTDFTLKDNQLVSVRYIQDGQEQEIPAKHVILALGHSARDTLEMLYDKKISLAQKPFAMGVRIEHLQEDINKALYGKFWNHEALGAADYKLAVHLKNGRSLYTFCMCPGGEVIASASETGRLTVNGMSYFKRDGRNANSALLVGITPDDFGSEHPLAGMSLQRQIEENAFQSAGGNYFAPVICVKDFLHRRESRRFGRIRPTYTPATAFVSPDKYLPSYMCETLRAGLKEMDKRLKGFACDDAVLTGVEARSSSPVRILRDENFYSISIKGFYPCGEGAGYAGGITSASVDGIRCAEALIKNLNEVNLHA